jgi:energy-coupling factor transporter transmembrane protein EcfT
LRPALAYRPGRSPLHRASASLAVAFLMSFAAIAFAFSSPLVLLADGVALALCGLAAGARRAVGAALRLGATLLVLMTAVNALVSHRGDTVLVRGWELPLIGSTDVTLESLAQGAAIGLRAAVVILAFAIYSACVDPDRVLRALRPIARRSALTAGLVARLVPLAVADLAALREAVRLRGPAAAPVGPAALTRRLVEGSLDRSVDVAATLELRGHSLPSRTVPSPLRTAPAPLLAASAAAVIAAGVAALAAGAGGFDAFPTVSMDTGPATLTLCAALPLLALAPFARMPRRARAPRAAVAGGAGV